MMDTYANLAEVTRYTRHFVSAAANVQDLHAIVGELILEQQHYLEQFSVLLSQAETSRSQVSMTGQSERELSVQVRDRLRRLYDQLQALRHDHTFDLKRFFETGRKQDIGESVAQRTRTLSRCIEALKQYPELPGASSWLPELESLQAGFTGVSGSRSAKDSAKRSDTQNLKRIRREWVRSYGAAKHILRGVLMRQGREAEWKGLFLDLQVGGGSGSSGGEATAGSGSGDPGAP